MPVYLSDLLPEMPESGLDDPRSDALWQAVNYTCRHCLDSRIAFHNSAPAWCDRCTHLVFANEVANAQLCAKFTDRVAARKLVNLQVLKTARALVKATPERPVTGRVLQAHLGVSERAVKGFVELLRCDWQLPIGSSREEPHGYYWISTPEQFDRWFQTFSAQAMAELKTAYRLMKSNYPELAGQLPLHFRAALEEEQ
jgi:biotin operon repressor